MWIENLPPFIPFFVGAMLLPFLPNRARYFALLIPVWGGLNLFFGAGKEGLRWVFLGWSMILDIDHLGM